MSFAKSHRPSNMTSSELGKFNSRCRPEKIRERAKPNIRKSRSVFHTRDELATGKTKSKGKAKTTLPQAVRLAAFTKPEVVEYQRQFLPEEIQKKKKKEKEVASQLAVEMGAEIVREHSPVAPIDSVEERVSQLMLIGIGRSTTISFSLNVLVVGGRIYYHVRITRTTMFLILALSDIAPVIQFNYWHVSQHDHLSWSLIPM